MRYPCEIRIKDLKQMPYNLRDETSKGLMDLKEKKKFHNQLKYSDNLKPNLQATYMIEYIIKKGEG